MSKLFPWGTSFVLGAGLFWPRTDSQPRIQKDARDRERPSGSLQALDVGSAQSFSTFPDAG